jgi:SAM-dependent methyltransferase
MTARVTSRGRGASPDPVAVNRRAWDTTSAHHAKHSTDEGARLRAGTVPPSLAALDGALPRALGDLRGKDVLHLLCNRGAETIALSRGTASMTGVDLSPAAVREARRLGREAASDAVFVAAEATSWLARTPRRFDVAFASWGVTCWLPDIAKFARGVTRVLRPGGLFVLLDGHPAANSGAGVGDPGDSYFGDSGRTPRRERWFFDYHGRGDRREVDIAWWQWTIGDVVSAFAAAGLRIEELREFEGTLPDYYGTWLPLERIGTSGVLPGRRGVIPLSFLLRGVRG